MFILHLSSNFHPRLGAHSQAAAQLRVELKKALEEAKLARAVAEAVRGKAEVIISRVIMQDDEQ